MFIYIIGMTAAGFLSGSIMYSYIIPKQLYKIDVRQNGDDGNPGGMNAASAAGLAVGLICIVLDLLKAFAPVFVAADVLGVSGYAIVPVAAAPVLGHAFSPFLKGKGGKAVAASFGALLGLIPFSRVAFLVAVVMIIFKFVIRISPDSFTVIAAWAVSDILILCTEPLMEVKIAALAISLVVCYKQYINPNKDALRVKIGRFSICYEHKKFTFIK